MLTQSLAQAVSRPTHPLPKQATHLRMLPQPKLLRVDTPVTGLTPSAYLHRALTHRSSSSNSSGKTAKAAAAHSVNFSHIRVPTKVFHSARLSPLPPCPLPSCCQQHHHNNNHTAQQQSCPNRPLPSPTPSLTICCVLSSRAFVKSAPSTTAPPRSLRVNTARSRIAFLRLACCKGEQRGERQGV